MILAGIVELYRDSMGKGFDFTVRISKILCIVYYTSLFYFMSGRV